MFVVLLAASDDEVDPIPPSSCGFGFGTAEVRPIERVSQLTFERFAEDFLAHGRPLVVTDAVVGHWPEDGRRWTPARVVEEVAPRGGVVMDWSGRRAALAAEEAAQAQAEDAQVYVTWVNQISEADAADNFTRFDALQAWLEAEVPLPYFLQPGWERMAADGLPRVSWIYMGRRGAGATRHRDRVCEGSWSAQLRGRKRWCLLEHPHGPGYEVLLEPGEMLVWYVPMQHETHIVEDALSVHGYFPLTAPTPGDPLTPYLHQLCLLRHVDVAFDDDYEACFHGLAWPCPGGVTPAKLSPEQWRRRWRDLGPRTDADDTCQTLCLDDCLRTLETMPEEHRQRIGVAGPNPEQAFPEYCNNMCSSLC